ncbi:MAG: hypothetical protein MZV63_26005 [Marinilabiliales bacterium]|nr:hypothetical protein [Marinilabiliales bacterium]
MNDPSDRFHRRGSSRPNIARAVFEVEDVDFSRVVVSDIAEDSLTRTKRIVPRCHDDIR